MNSYGLVRVADACPGVVVDMRYASERNVFGVRLYDGDEAWLLAVTARKLAAAAALAAEDGRTLIVLDAYRPLSAQARMWEALPEPGFVAPPSRGSNHNRGAAVDVTLAGADGLELPMPSGFDEFSERASRAYRGGDRSALANSDALRGYMEKAGFRAYDGEWWHFNDPDNVSCPLIDVPITSL